MTTARDFCSSARSGWTSSPALRTRRTPRFNLLSGRVRRCSFLGNILRYAVDVDGIAPVTIDLQNAVGVSPLAQGTPVTLRWPVADSLILPPATP